MKHVLYNLINFVKKHLKEIINFSIIIIGFIPISCTIPVLFDREYGKTLQSPTMFVFSDRLWVMGVFHKIVGKKYDPPQLFYSSEGRWENIRKVILHGKVYSISDENEIIKTMLNVSRNIPIFIDNKLHVEGRINTFGLYWRRSKYFIEHDGKIYVVGGKLDNNFFSLIDEQTYDDVWYSSDGLNWTLATKKTPWFEKDKFSKPMIAGSKGYIYAVIADYYKQHAITWRSRDGIEWEKTADIQGITIVHKMFSFRDRLYLLGEFKDRRRVLFSSVNGKEWIKINSFPKVYSIDIVSCCNKMYGFSESEQAAYVSDDGKKWDILGRKPRFTRGIIVFNDRMIALEPRDNTVIYDSIFYSRDGINWEREFYSSDGIHWERGKSLPVSSK